MLQATNAAVAGQGIDYVDAVFGSSGYLAQRFAGYRVRDGQVALARAVDSAILNRDGKRHLIAEGPTGTGKSLAYCVPAIYNTAGQVNDSGEPKRAMIVTGNIALQEQLVGKDLPLLQQILPLKFSFALLKGMQNYLCLDEDNSTRAEIEMNVKLPIYREEDTDQYNAILEWGLKTQTGDVSELDFVPNPSVWAKFSTPSDDCKRSKCDWAHQCFPMKAQAHARESQIIVTNYHMFFAHLKVRMMTGGMVGILPSYDYVICDEAHKAADIAREFFGSAFSFSALKKVLRKIEQDDSRGKKKRFVTEEAKRAAALGIDREATAALEHEATLFFGDLTRHMKSKEYKIRLKKKDPVDSQHLLTELAMTRKNVSKLATSLSGHDDLETSDSEISRASSGRKKELEIAYSKLGEAISVIKRGMNLGLDPDPPEVDPFDLSEDAASAAADASSSTPKSVFFLEPDFQDRAVLREKLISVAGILRNELFDSSQSAIITSATLATGNNNFEYIRDELGAPRDETVTMIAETPFDYKRQSLLIVPDEKTICLPTDRENFALQVPEVVYNTIMLAKGRTLCLFTSYKNLKDTAKFLQSKKLPFKLLIQNDKPRTMLVEEFKADESSVLLGTESFWAGVDVPGPSLSCVIIDKIPFPTPEDPILDAIPEEDRPFFTFSIPRAMIQLKQGVGRLIRSVSDRGVVVLLDRRIVEKSYGSGFLKSLPPMMRTRKLSAVAEFLGDA